MQKIELTVHEFMCVMGHMDELMNGKVPTGSDSLYAEWYDQWKALDQRLEKLPLMDRADMLFDGKVAINYITEKHLKQLVDAVEYQVQLHEKLIADGDEDGDPEDLEIWMNRRGELQDLLTSSDWSV